MSYSWGAGGPRTPAQIRKRVEQLRVELGKTESDRRRRVIQFEIERLLARLRRSE